MNNKLQEIYDGWKNFLVPDKEIEKYVEKIAQNRINICRTCPWNSRNRKTIISMARPDVHCTKCGCPEATKTRSLTSECPLDPPKWTAEVKE